MARDMEKLNALANNYTGAELVQALALKMGFDLDKVTGKDIVDKFIETPIPDKSLEQLDVFKGKKVLVGDYFKPGFHITKEVLESLGLEVFNEETEPNMYNRLASGEKFDVVITNNIYRSGGSGPELLKKLKALDGFNTPVIIHTIAQEPIEYFLNMGFDGCLKKPIKQVETLELLNKIFSKTDGGTN